MFNKKSIASSVTLALQEKVIYIRRYKKITETSQPEDEKTFCSYYYSQMIDQLHHLGIKMTEGNMLPNFFENLLELDERNNLTFYPYVINLINKHLLLNGEQLRVMRGKSPNQKALVFYKP